MMTGARAVALHTDPTGRRVTGLDIDVDGSRRTVIASTYVVAAGAINSAALLLRSASDRHPKGLANATGLVGRNYMAHLNSALMAVRPKANGTVFQKTLALNDWYFGESRARVGMGHAQLLGKLQAEMLQGAVPWAPKWALAELAGRSVDWYLMTEDLPDPENRVSLDSSGRVIVNFRANNEKLHKRLVRSMASGDAASRLPDDPDPPLRRWMPLPTNAEPRSSATIPRRQSWTRCVAATMSRISSSWMRRSFRPRRHRTLRSRSQRRPCVSARRLPSIELGSEVNR